MVALAKRQGLELEEQNLDLTEFKIEHAEEWLKLLNKKIASKFAEEAQAIKPFYHSVCQYIYFLNQDFNAAFKSCRELIDLHKSMNTILESMAILSISMPSVSFPEQKVFLTSDISPLYQGWFKMITQPCIDYINVYQKLGLMVAAPAESLAELNESGIKADPANLFFLWTRINDSFLFQAETKDLKSQLIVPAIWLAPDETVGEEGDILRYIKDKTVKVFENCISVQEKCNYLDELYQYLLAECHIVKNEINSERNKIMAAIVDQSDAFMLGVPSDNKSLIIINDFINPHGYIRELISRISESQRNPLWEPLLNFADRYFQLVYKTHYIQHFINKNDANDTSDEFIGALMKTPLYKNEIDLFLELVAKAEEAALNLNHYILS